MSLNDLMGCVVQLIFNMAKRLIKAWAPIEKSDMSISSHFLFGCIDITITLSIIDSILCHSKEA